MDDLLISIMKICAILFIITITLGFMFLIGISVYNSL